MFRQLNLRSAATILVVALLAVTIACNLPADQAPTTTPAAVVPPTSAVVQGEPTTDSLESLEPTKLIPDQLAEPAEPTPESEATAIPQPTIQPPQSDATLNPAPPASPVKLVFIHHSTGGNWLASSSDYQRGGGLGQALMDNNYFVSATNYGWGPDSIGDRTDIVNWQEWFLGSHRDEIMQAVYDESGQNEGGFGDWPRLDDPGGENEIILFKSCFPNSNLFGNSDDRPAAEINYDYTVANAKAIYIALLDYFSIAQDKLFVVITAPPMARGEYGEDPYGTPEQRAANARAFNDWLVNEWLLDYPYENVVVFDYYTVLTSNGSATRVDDPNTTDEPADNAAADGNHHRWNGSEIEHLQTVNNHFSAYPSDSNWDSHPTSQGHQKATAEFVPLLNIYYHRWQEASGTTTP